MLTGVEILLERMKTNPDEFIDGAYSKWGRVLAMGREFFTEEERSALDIGLIGARREAFNGEVLRVLTGNDEQEPERNYPYATTTAGPVGYTTSMGNAITSMINAKQNKIIASASVMKQAEELLEKEFDKEYAKKGSGY